LKLFYGEIIKDSVFIHKDEQTHISKVLRMKEGDRVSVTNGLGDVVHGEIYFKGKNVLVNSLETRLKTPNFPYILHLAIAPTKNIARTEFFVEKATEMGISEISFLITENSERKIINIDRIRKLVISASKQSLRYYFPKVNDMVKISDFLDNINVSSTYAAHCNSNFERIEISDIKIDNEICFLIGPEGDFSLKEMQILKEKQVRSVSLGSRRLRTETAGIFISSWNYGRMNLCE